MLDSFSIVSAIMEAAQMDARITQLEGLIAGFTTTLQASQQREQQLTHQVAALQTTQQASSSSSSSGGGPRERLGIDTRALGKPDLFTGHEAKWAD